MKIILASSSPRRKEILKSMNIDFEVIPSNVVEELNDTCDVKQNVLKNAQNKAGDVFQSNNNDRIVIGADTVVYFNNQILGKPKTCKKAKELLQKLSGNQCVAYTGMCIIAKIKEKQKIYNDVSWCKILIKELTNKEIQDYINTNEPLDKAGGFAIQGIGSRYIQSINGDFYSGVGLSISNLYDTLKMIQQDFDIEMFQ